MHIGNAPDETGAFLFAYADQQKKRMHKQNVNGLTKNDAYVIIRQ